MSKVNKKWAQAGLEATQAEMVNIPSTPPANVAEGEMVQVGGLEPIVASYQDRPYTGTKPLPYPIVPFQQGQTFVGTYFKLLERDAKTRDGRRFKSFSYLVRQESDGKLIKLQSSSLNRFFGAIEEGAKVLINCVGSNVSKKDGNEYVNFTTFASRGAVKSE